MDADRSRVWFTDLWNYSIIPYALEAVREGLQVGGSLLPLDSVPMRSSELWTLVQ